MAVGRRQHFLQLRPGGGSVDIASPLPHSGVTPIRRSCLFSKFFLLPWGRCWRRGGAGTSTSTILGAALWRASRGWRACPTAASRPLPSAPPPPWVTSQDHACQCSLLNPSAPRHQCARLAGGRAPTAAWSPLMSPLPTCVSPSPWPLRALNGFPRQDLGAGGRAAVSA